MGRWEERMSRARKLHRPSLSDWESDGLYDVFPEFVDNMLSDSSRNYETFVVPSDDQIEKQPQQKQQHPVQLQQQQQLQQQRQIPVQLNAETLSAQQFWTEYEAKEIPCVIRNIPAGYDGSNAISPSQQPQQQQQEGAPVEPPVPLDPWPAVRRWPLDRLRNDDTLRDRMFKCGEDDDGKSVKVKLKHFLRYLRSNHDDSPLYVFDTSFDEDTRAQRLLQDYTVPLYFRDDLFRFISESRRAPYRWFLVGPERSGTCVHIDPLATNAWNTLIQGKKRWVLFPPHVPKHVVKGKGLVRNDEDDEAIHYFMYILPRIKRKAMAAIQQERLRQRMATGTTSSSNYTNNSNSKSMPPSSPSFPYHNFGCYEFTQHAGETVFVPNGWWHAVLNLTDTVGVTQNFCSERNFDVVWKQTRKGRPRLAYKWLQQLEQRPRYRHLAVRAKAQNAADRFVMKYDPAEVARRQAEREMIRRQEERRRKHRQKQKQREQQERKKNKMTDGESGETDEEGSSTTHTGSHNDDDNSSRAGDSSSTNKEEDDDRRRKQRRHHM